MERTNPWVTEDPSTSALRSMLLVAERNGHPKMDSSKLKNMADKCVSMRLMKTFREISEKNTKLNEVNLEIKCRLMDKETRDITHLDILESRISYLNELNIHLQSVVQHKDRLINTLQQPFVGDYFKLEATYHQHVKELFPLVASSLADVTTNIDNIQWASGFDLQDGKMEHMLDEIATCLAQLQTNVQALSSVSQTLQQHSWNDTGNTSSLLMG